MFFDFFFPAKYSSVLTQACNHGGCSLWLVHSISGTALTGVKVAPLSWDHRLHSQPGPAVLQYVPLVTRGSEEGCTCLDLHRHITAHGQSTPVHSDNGWSSGVIFLEGISQVGSSCMLKQMLNRTPQEILACNHWLSEPPGNGWGRTPQT